MTIVSKFVKVSLFVSAFSLAIASVDVGGFFELKYKSGIQKFVPEDFIIQFNAPINDKVEGELIWKNDAIESYFVGYKLNDSVSMKAGQLLVRFGEFYTHAVSDPFLKQDFEKFKPGINFVYQDNGFELIGGVHNNSTSDVANMYVARGQYKLNDSLVLGVSYLKDGDEKSAYGVFGVSDVLGVVLDAEYVIKDEDNYLAIGFTYPVGDDYAIVSRYEKAKAGIVEKQATILGLNVVLEKDLNLFLEAVNSDDGSGRSLQFMSKISLQF